MKLPIKKKYFDDIKSGKATFELRDAHITFMCEETGEELQMKVTGAGVDWKKWAIKYRKELTEEESSKLFTDEKLIWFRLETNK